ncbi:MAG TPA: hypothetical protein VLX92_26300 [Kofleriaceae bacterium]|nr:hypothetical protein [Kofleriaceae bacterium]
MHVRLPLIAIASVACHRTPTDREHLLTQLPGDVQLVAAADGAALADPAFHRVIDAARPHLPASWGCVLDAALASRAVALAGGRAGVTVLIATRAAPVCPQLGRLADGTWVATIGAGAPVPRDRSVAADPRWDRARAYLASAPLAAAADLGGRHVVLAAQPAPVDAWLAIDAGDPDATARDVDAVLARLHTAKLHAERAGDQVIVRGHLLDADALEGLAGELLRLWDRVPAAVVAPAPPCPPDARCLDPTHVEVASIEDVLLAIAAVPGRPIVQGDDIAGVELAGDAPLVRRGDIVFAVDALPIRDMAALAAAARRVGPHARVAIRRDGADIVLDLTQRHAAR